MWLNVSNRFDCVKRRLNWWNLSKIVRIGQSKAGATGYRPRGPETLLYLHPREFLTLKPLSPLVGCPYVLEFLEFDLDLNRRVEDA